MKRGIISFSIDLGLLRHIDNLRNDVPRSRFITRLIDQGLKETKKGNTIQMKKVIPVDDSSQAKEQQVSELFGVNQRHACQ